MRPLTFKGHLDRHVQELAGKQTRSLAELAAIARRRPDFTEPLFVWAAKTGRAARLSRYLEHRPALRGELANLATLEQQGRLDSVLADPDSGLRAEYTRVWEDYAYRRDARKREAEEKLSARMRVLALEANRHVTRYRMAKDLGLNPGNLHAFLAHGDPNKISLKRVSDLLGYLEVAC